MRDKTGRFSEIQVKSLRGTCYVLLKKASLNKGLTFQTKLRHPGDFEESIKDFFPSPAESEGF
ncbi:hypothetical protein PNBC_13200 [Paenibacillus crassostreae]|uniref:Uncharacterized protein n=1 Tax=Paenibacillus crassostreae TaxID=1763538 RepID=A0A167D6B9_9BACL|nr:hypothetical protein LPB68_05840 [Paenibacillus crassostreae]OAB73994.1 hypothetical protein PNBC_13200 [Paenibacillus crassostreae]